MLARMIADGVGKLWDRTESVRIGALWATGIFVAGAYTVDVIEKRSENYADIGIRFKETKNWIWLREHKQLPEEEIRKQFEKALDDFRIGENKAIVEVELPEKYDAIFRSPFLPPKSRPSPQPGSQ